MRRYLLSIVLTAFLPVCAWPQTTGLPPFGSLDQVGLETRNNQDLNVLLAIPIMSSPGRNGLDLNFNLVYNSSIWTKYLSGWVPNSTNIPPWGWTTRYSVGGTNYRTTNSHVRCNKCYLGDGCQYIDTTRTDEYAYTDPLGTLHSFAGVYYEDQYDECTGTETQSGTFSGYASDGSGYYISIDSGSGAVLSLFAKNGFQLQNGSITDRNGNYISSSVNGSETDWTDTAGRVALKVISGSSSVQYEFLDPSGNYQTATLNLQTLNIKTNFGCPVNEWSGTATLPTELDIPTPGGGTLKYLFAYEQTPGNTGYYTGRLHKVTLPTGGYYQYDYTGANDGINCADGTTLSMNRTVSDGTNTATSNYVRNTSSLTTTITTPKLADTANAFDTVVTFNSSGQEIKRQIYPNSPGSGTPLRTMNTTWATNGTPATVVTVLEDGTTQSKIATVFDSNGLLDQECAWDFGSGGPGGYLRCTNFSYNTSSNYTSRNILDLVTSKSMFGATGPIQYRQDITYDGVALSNCPTGQPQHNDASYSCTFNYRGNPTSVTTYLSPSVPSGGITKNFTYDFFGNLLTAQLNCCQTKTWAYSSATQYSEPDSVTSGTSPTQLKTSATYYASTGQIKTSTDENNLVTSFSYDTLHRPTSVSQTNGENVSYSYDDTHFTATTTTKVDSSKSVQQITALDGLGRPNLTTTEDASDNVYSKVSTNYDLAGRAYQTSNPYTGSTGSYWTTTQFDVLGRPISVTLPDNSATTYSYSTNTATVTDPTGKQRKSVMDAAGRLSSVYEPDPTNGNSLTLQTSYTYNVMDELTQISQGSQTRTYVYDALGRLNSATTPEGGMVCYGAVSGGTCNSNGYDNFDNLLYRTDARGVLTSYGYDGLNRLTGISYNVSGATGVPATASVGLTYGANASQYNNGRLITMTDGVGSENYSYNNLGQLAQLQKVIGTTTYTINYAFNLANELTQITYPSGRVVQQSVDPIGRLCEIAPSTSGCGQAASPYVTGYAYNAASLVTGLKYGNGIYASFGFSSDRLQLSCLDYSTSNRSGNCAHDSTTKFGLTYSYGSAGSNNGQISSITDYVQAGRSITYTYDSLYRLTKATTTGSTSYPAWGLSEAYDRYGNRSAQSISSGCSGITCPTNSVSVSATTNQLTGSYGYDASGNMTNDGLNTITYDGEGRAVTASGALGSGTYTYDGNGLRVKKVAGTTTTVYIFSGSKVIAEYVNGAAPSSPTQEYIYAGGALLARIDSSGTKYYHQDHLSNRMVTNSSGSVAAEMGHFPFGESWYNATNDKLYFTTYEYDAESGNHYAMARYHVSRLGRLSSPDPIDGSKGKPQSLNRYSYSMNDPLNMADATGKWPTPVHDDILERAFPGLSSSQIGTLEAASAWVDSFQDPADAYMHAQCSPGDSMDDCATQIDDFIAGEMSDAQDTGFNGSGLWDLGEAIHTMTDMTSPWHSLPDGTPTCWGCSTGADLNHVFGEDGVYYVMPDIFSLAFAQQIAQAVRNAQATFEVTFPDQYKSATAGFFFGFYSWASNIAYMDLVVQTGSINPSPVLQNEFTDCLLGNPAACPDQSDFEFQSLISGGGPWPEIACMPGKNCITY
ncbi:MAG TPA: RHS repeat-associated core domain-containing protein [Candidatus Acidoferrales bacterium]|nr:RHS repeat-associated core domain-containing protein [Candidatus Acidoferrales bacterium]